MNIVIDCRSLRKQPAGVPNFLIEVINLLGNQEKGWTIYLLSNEDFHPAVETRLSLAENIVKIISPLPVLRKIALIWYVFKLPLLVKSLNADLFLSPIPNLPPSLPWKTKKMIVVHDMVYKLFPDTMSFTNRMINFFFHDRSIRSADLIWAVSDYTRKEINRLFPKRKSGFIMTGSAVNKNIFKRNPDFSVEEKSSIATRYGIGGKIILAVGTLEPRKNLSFLVSLMPDLSMHGFSLIIVGAVGWGNVHLSQRKNTSIAGFISNDELVKLYHAADLCVSTSLNEGFGLPQLEAMCCGCPVVSSHNSANIELVQGAGETVEGWDRNDWINAILKVSRNRDYYIDAGYKRSLNYDWNTIGNAFIHYVSH